MPVDAGFGDSLSSSSFGNVNFSFDISTPTEFDLGFKRKRPSPETTGKKTDDSSVITFVPEVENNDDPVQLNKHYPSQAGYLDKASDHSSRGLPKFSSDFESSSTASVSHSKPVEGRTNKEDDSTPKKRSKDSSGNRAIGVDAGALVSDGKSLQPADALLRKLVEDIKDSTLKQWANTFSDLESFGSSKIQLLDQILAAALDHEARLKKQKAELRESLLKLSDTLC